MANGYVMRQSKKTRKCLLSRRIDSFIPMKSSRLRRKFRLRKYETTINIH